MRHLHLFLLAIAALSSTAPPALAICEDALIRSTLNTSLKDDVRLATLVTESVWDEASHNGGANAVLYGIPVGASYGDYKTRAQSSLNSLNYSRAQSFNLAWTGLDPNANTPYQACLQAEVARSPGLHLGVRAADRSHIVLLLNWNIPSAPPINVTWTTPSIGRQNLRTNFPQGATSFAVPRPNADVVLAASYRGLTSEVVTLTPLPAAAPPPPQKICRVIFRSNPNDLRNFVQPMAANASPQDCARFAQRFMPESTDVKVGCRPAQGNDRFGDQQFAITPGRGFDPNLSAGGPPFGPDPNCGWN
jgi:hypothetical protein